MGARKSRDRQTVTLTIRCGEWGQAARQSHIAYGTLTAWCAQCVPTCVLPSFCQQCVAPVAFEALKPAVEVEPPSQFSLEPLLGDYLASEDSAVPDAKTKRRRKTRHRRLHGPSHPSTGVAPAPKLFVFPVF
jgi:hypothetical protein